MGVCIHVGVVWSTCSDACTKVAIANLVRVGKTTEKNVKVGCASNTCKQTSLT